MKATIPVYIFLLLVMHVGVVRAQDKTFQIVCTYQLSYQPDSTDANSRKSEDMYLLLNDHSSFFTSKRHYMQDSFFSGPFEEREIFPFTKANPTNFRYSVYKDLTGELTFEDVINGIRYQYKEPYNTLTWRVLTDTATIHGYHCQKAVTQYSGRKWSAWFTQEIPIADGPYKFSGLPGLIIKINDDQGYYTFTLTELANRLCTVLTPADTKVTATEKDQFSRALAYYKSHAFEAMKARLNMRFANVEVENKARTNVENRYKKENNPLELLPVTVK